MPAQHALWISTWLKGADAALAELPEWTALPLVASLAGVPLACTEDTGSHYQEQSPHQRGLGRTQVWSRCSQ